MVSNSVYDKVVIGAGLYGLYAALHSARRGERVVVLERDCHAFSRATYINQARVHMGYHYPRSYSTAIKSAGYFDRFCDDFGFCIKSSFDQVYATAASFSWTNATQFSDFCSKAAIDCDPVPVGKYFKEGVCDGAFLTKEYTYDAASLMQYFTDELDKLPNAEICFDVAVVSIVRENSHYRVETDGGLSLETAFLLNATYASVNQVASLVDDDLFKLKYELCEIILCEVCEELKDVGLTVMDGPFFSLMPFGLTGYHSLTSVAFTPHITSYESVPTFKCQLKTEGVCTPASLFNCNDCEHRPLTAWPYMSQLARHFMKDDLRFERVRSLYSMKPILVASEVDDSRPTAIKCHSKEPYFISVLSGKINTIYDLDPFLVSE